MVTGRWGTPSEVLLDLTVADDGTVTGLANPGGQDARIRRGHFDARTGAIELDGEHKKPDGTSLPFQITGRLDGRVLRLDYQYGETRGSTAVVRVEEYRPAPLTLWERLKPLIDDFRRRLYARTRPTGRDNARKLRERGESLDAIVFRDAVAADIPALADLHVTTWNATYNTTRGPTAAIRAWQWNQVFANEQRRDFVLVLEDRNGRLIGFTWGKPHEGEFEGELSKIYLRWEYHGLGLGRRMLAETAQRFLDRGIRSFILFAERSNPTLGFYDRMGGERLVDDRGRFGGGFGWRDLTKLVEIPVPEPIGFGNGTPFPVRLDEVDRQHPKRWKVRPRSELRPPDRSTAGPGCALTRLATPAETAALAQSA